MALIKKIKFAIFIISLTFLLSGSSGAVQIAWDAVEAGAQPTGYNAHWGNEPGVYVNTQNVGLVTQAEIPAPFNSYIAVTAYNDSGESGYSNEIYYAQLGIQPASGGQIYTLEIVPSGTERRPGDGWEAVYQNGNWLIIFDSVNSGNIIRVFK
jgi:hypothetical protein